ncbi:centrosomal protein of 131 kDa isoform X2 [Pieris rapae]|uniref:centrosomal protein of 131 kDa isoform X2 n=1 Tax=Pieris rapae TaxID=64459 RepID=UPI001E27EF91|nr:centrosomal protein of 131 kDa isoform X2 [Pieris rapae]
MVNILLNKDLEFVMSKENNNLRLLGSPVNLSYRNKKREDKKNNKGRPRSALQNSSVSDNQDHYKRPFSADTKDRAPTTRSFFKAFSAELLQSYNSPLTVKVLPPTEQLLGTSKTCEKNAFKKNKEICSNASDIGSEDTFISLGTKIKAKAQSGPKNRNSNPKNALRYRSIAKRNKKNIDDTNHCLTNDNYGMEITITERPRSTSPIRYRDIYQHRSFSPPLKNQYESYFLAFNENYKNTNVPNYTSSLSVDEANALDVFDRRQLQTKPQLSLVEEESTQDLDSNVSQNMISLPRDSSCLDNKDLKQNDTNGFKLTTNYLENSNKEKEDFTSELQTYRTFLNDFHTNLMDKSKTSSRVHTDSSSKDSGYPESAVKEDKQYHQNHSLPSTSFNIISHESKEPRSFDSASSQDNNKENSDKWVEPLNHSRLLYKDFFLKKEGNLALPPQNTPKNDKTPSTSEDSASSKFDDNVNLEYPSYLLNSSTKAYTSKVIEDYKKEIAAINTLHELTLKDIKTDAISPTPLNINEMFDQYSTTNDKSTSNNDDSKVIDKTLDAKNSDISKVSTKELIQNYLKVKSDYKPENLVRNTKKFDKKFNNIQSKNEENSGYKRFWNNRNAKNVEKNVSANTQSNAFTTRTPLSARIDSVQTDKDIESWMSLSASSPRLLELDKEDTIDITQKKELAQIPNSPLPKEIETEKTETPINTDIEKSKELSANSTVLDIYSMLKEIESYGDNPVTSIADTQMSKSESKEEEISFSPKDNFMEIFQFLEKVEQSANDALSVVTTTTPQTMPKLESLLKLPQTELAQRLVTASLQLEERSCCIALLQESLTNHKEQMISKISNLEKQSHRNIGKVKQECEETIKRHQNFIDQLINDKKTLNHRIEELVNERRSLEERWKRSAQTLEERYKLELKNQHDKMAAAQQVARQRWVRQKAEKIKELTVKGLEGELREMAERQQKEVSDLKMFHAEQIGKLKAQCANEMEELRRTLEREKEEALVKERQLASTRMEKQILELEMTYQEQRTRLIAELRAENERVAHELSERDKLQKEEFEKWREEQERLLEIQKQNIELEIKKEKEKLEEQMNEKRLELDADFEKHKREFEAEQQVLFKRRVTELSAQHKLERDREIEKAIESLEAEAQTGRKELQDALRRNKEHYETELKELAETEAATLKRYQDAQARVRLQEDKCAELEVKISQLETRNRVLTEKNIQLEGRAEEIKSSCEEAWKNKVEALQREIEEMKKTHEEQMHQLYAKVKVAVARKDSAIQALTRESAKYQEKVTLLEQKLQQQRKDFLKSK